MRREIFKLLLSFELITCGEKLSQQYTQTGFLSGSAQIGQCAGDRRCSSAHRRRRRCSCRLWQETACSATPCVCEQMDAMTTRSFFLDTFSQDKSCVHLEPRRETENTACRNARACVPEVQAAISIGCENGDMSPVWIIPPKNRKTCNRDWSRRKNTPKLRESDGAIPWKLIYHCRRFEQTANWIFADW